MPHILPPVQFHGKMVDNWCRTCLQKVSSDYYHLDHTEPDEIVSIGTKLQSVVPNLDLHAVLDPVICSACLRIINATYTFQSQCFTVDKHIDAYCTSNGTNTVIFKDLIGFIESTSDTVTTEVTLIKDEDIPDLTAKHNNEKSFDCNQCGCSFRWLRNLQRHLLTHKQTKPFECELCDFKSKRKDALNNHIANRHVENETKQFKCEHCDQSFAQRYTLTRHLQIHAERKQYRCSQCDFTCKFESYLKRHLSTHANKLKPFKCNICNYSSFDRKGLHRHMMIHTGEKPFACDDCSYKTSEKSKLKRHQMIHARECQCELCGYKTRFEKQLTLHIRTVHH